MKIIIGALILHYCYIATLTAPVSRQGKVLFIEPNTVHYHASFIHSTMILTSSDTIMHFPTGGTYDEKLIQVSLGEIDPHALIRVTVAMKPRPTDEDSDPHFGLTDTVNENLIRISDAGGRCQIKNGRDIDPALPSGSTQHYEYILLFEPFQNFGACSHFGGHITPGYFDDRLDPSNGLDFVVRRESTGEQYDFYYFLIEIL